MANVYNIMYIQLQFMCSKGFGLIDAADMTERYKSHELLR